MKCSVDVFLGVPVPEANPGSVRPTVRETVPAAGLVLAHRPIVVTPLSIFLEAADVARSQSWLSRHDTGRRPIALRFELLPAEKDHVFLTLFDRSIHCAGTGREGGSGGRPLSSPKTEPSSGQASGHHQVGFLSRFAPRRGGLGCGANNGKKDAPKGSRFHISPLSRGPKCGFGCGFVQHMFTCPSQGVCTPRSPRSTLSRRVVHLK